MIFEFLFGLSLGSFFNVVIDRLPQGLALGGRSRADCCGLRLGFLDLIPLFSYLFSRGRCRHCQKTISPRYPLVEVLTGLLTLLALSEFPFPFSFYVLINFYFLLIFFFIDLRYGVVPLPLIFLNFIFLVLANLYFYWSGRSSLAPEILNSILAALFLALFFVFLIIITRRRGMGEGDVFLVFLYSLMVGFPNSLVFVFLSFIFGGLSSLLLIIGGFKKFGQTLPFGPFMSLAAGAAILWGKNLLDWYGRLVLG